MFNRYIYIVMISSLIIAEIKLLVRIIMWASNKYPDWNFEYRVRDFDTEL